MKAMPKTSTPRAPTPLGLEGQLVSPLNKFAGGQEKLTESGEVINWVKDNVAF